MMKYGADPIEHKFILHCTEIEHRGQWVDVFLSLQLAADEKLPEGLLSPSVLVICSQDGNIVQTVLHDEGCDSEFQFTYTEKEKVERFIQDQIVGLLINKR
ncbi:hypothetical protein [Paenibacillus eucommiae]|uniref:Uncharacterized protein n=1 Tax=Paenibacillus eucommiae TaxID=1355755 RepID=A0ABS4J621_9BACL|nr:hypothetical protein [Paenibacillus eucommiae]MBP1995277.1 hypothetical protein [Paenibacillus eucommiae]